MSFRKEELAPLAAGSGAASPLSVSSKVPGAEGAATSSYTSFLGAPTPSPRVMWARGPSSLSPGHL